MWKRHVKIQLSRVYCWWMCIWRCLACRALWLTMRRVFRISSSMRGSTPLTTDCFTKATPQGEKFKLPLSLSSSPIGTLSCVHPNSNISDLKHNNVLNIIKKELNICMSTFIYLTQIQNLNLLTPSIGLPESTAVKFSFMYI